MEKMSCSCTWGTGNINHNFNKKSREKQDHIDNSKIDDNIILKEISPKTIEQEFNKIFAQDVEEYNSRQKRNDRKIDSYYQKCLDDKRIKAPFREVIYQVGNKDDVKNKDKKDKMIKSLTKFYNEFEKNYPNLKVIGAVIHLDEATPHLHLDVVPYAENNKRGMKHKVSFEKAIEQMGFKPEESQVNKNVKDPLIFNGFRNHSMQLLENILNEEGIERDVKNNTKKHLQPSDFKKERDAIEELKKDPKIQEKAFDELTAVYEEEFKDKREELESLEKSIESSKKFKEKHKTEEYEAFEKAIKAEKKVQEITKKKDQAQKEYEEQLKKNEEIKKQDLYKQQEQQIKTLQEENTKIKKDFKWIIKNIVNKFIKGKITGETIEEITTTENPADQEIADKIYNDLEKEYQKQNPEKENQNPKQEYQGEEEE